VAECLERAACAELEILSRTSVRAQVETVLKTRLRDGDGYGREAVARRLACTPRALRRALEAEGTSFRRIEEGVRRDLALALVGGTELSLVAVAERCQFAGLPAFCKAFRRWTAHPPSEFRQLRMAPPASASGRRARQASLHHMAEAAEP
jgi:AraC-like DNA-binding protein